MQSVRRATPWLAALLALPFALIGLSASAPTACGELPSAFSSGVETEQSDTLVVVASHCETRRKSDGFVVEKTIVNWSGLAAAVGVLVGAWLVGAVAVGRISRRTASIGIVLAAATVLGALTIFFL